MSTARQENRGKRKNIFNSIKGRFDNYRLSKRGLWILMHPFSSEDVKGAQHLSKREMSRLENI